MFTNRRLDLASLTTRAERRDGVFHIFGKKTRTTHGARADLMTLLVRTDPAASGYKGLSMLLARSRAVTTQTRSPRAWPGARSRGAGLSWMEEYEIRFDGFEVPAQHLLGGIEGRVSNSS